MSFRPRASTDTFLRHEVGVLRRRARWLVLGLIGGVIGAFITTLLVKPLPPQPHYFKATETRVMAARIVNPLNTSSFSIGQIPSLLQSPQMQTRIAMKLELSPGTVSAQVGVVADAGPNAVDFVAVAGTPEEAVDLATTSADILSAEAIRVAKSQDVLERAQLSRQLDELRAENDRLLARLEAEPDQDDLIRVEMQYVTQRYSELDQQLEALGDPVELTFETIQSARPIEINGGGYAARINNNLGARGTVSGAQVVQASTAGELDLSTPKEFSKINRIALGGIAGLVVGVFAALLADAWDDRVRGHASTAELTELPLLAEISKLDRKQRRELMHRQHTAALAPFVEQFRSVRSSLLFSLGLEVGEHAEGEAPVVLVASPGAREGRTTTVAGLAHALSGTGLRTLVVDGDLRRPMVSRMLGVIPNLVERDAPLTTRIEGIDYLPPPRREPDVADAINDVRARIEKWRGSYDLILVDAAPFLVTNDATEYLVSSCDAVLAVWRVGVTNVESAAKMLAIIDRFDVEVVGVVLNACDRTEVDTYLGGATTRHGEDSGLSDGKPVVPVGN